MCAQPVGLGQIWQFYGLKASVSHATSAKAACCVAWLLEWSQRARVRLVSQCSENLQLLAFEKIAGRCHLVPPWPSGLSPIEP
ncbi:hypothetical protein SLE2022_191320 [Rubroshorea leprosula]